MRKMLNTAYIIDVLHYFKGSNCPVAKWSYIIISSLLENMGLYVLGE